MIDCVLKLFCSVFLTSGKTGMDNWSISSIHNHLCLRDIQNTCRIKIKSRPVHYSPTTVNGPLVLSHSGSNICVIEENSTENSENRNPREVKRNKSPQCQSYGNDSSKSERIERSCSCALSRAISSPKMCIFFTTPFASPNGGTIFALLWVLRVGTHLCRIFT